MNAGSIICFFIYLFVALFMIVIGVSQLKSRTPVAFYSGEQPFKAQDLSDVSMWNKKHGAMWILYGVIIIISYAIGLVIGVDSLWCLIPLIGGTVVPLPVMIWYHHRLIRLYRRPADMH